MNHKFTVFGYFSKTTPLSNLPPKRQKVAQKFMLPLLTVFFMAFYLPFIAHGQSYQTFVAPSTSNNGWNGAHWTIASSTSPSTCPSSGSGTFNSGNKVYLCTSGGTGSGVLSGSGTIYGIIATANYAHNPSGAGTLTFTSSNMTPTIEVDNTAVADFNATKFSTSYALVKTGTGTLISSPSSSTFSGGFKLNGGTMVVGSIYAFGSGTVTIPSSTSCTLASTASSTLTFSNALSINSSFTLGTTASLGSYYNSGNNGIGGLIFSGNATLANSPTITLGGSSSIPSTYSFSGVLSGTSALTVSGTGGILALTSTSTANSFTGNVTITGGAELDINNDGNLGAGSNVILNNGILKVANTGTVTTARGIALSTSTSNTINTPGTLVCTGLISGTGSLTKTGAGVLQVDNTAGTNTASGTVTVNAGDLDIAASASIPASVSVGSGAIISGVGTYGAVTIGSGGYISPGNDLGTGATAGTLTTGTQNWQSGGTYTCTINNVSGTAGSAWDYLTINGNLSVPSTGTPFVVKLEASGGAITGFTTSTPTTTWVIGTYSGSGPSGTTSFVTVDQSAITGGPYPGTFTITFTSGIINLVYTAPDFDFYWTGAVSSDWNTAGNWQNPYGTTATTVPGSYNNVYIQNVSTAPIFTLSSATINSLTVNTSASLTLEGLLTTSSDVTNSGTITLSASGNEGQLTVGGNLTNNASSTISFSSTPGANTISITGSTTNSGIITLSSGLLQPSGVLTNSGTIGGMNSNGYLQAYSDLSNSGSITLSGGNLQIYGDLSNSGSITLSGGDVQFYGGIPTYSTSSIDATSGTVEFDAMSSDQTIPANLFVNNTVNNLTINNGSTGSGVTLGGTLNITGMLNPIAGTFNTGSTSTTPGVPYLTMKSTSLANTAIVGQVGGTISGTVTTETYIPQGYRGYYDLCPEVQGAGSIFTNWQEGGSTAAGHGIFITDASAMSSNPSYGETYNTTTGFDYSVDGISSSFTYGTGSEAALWPAFTNTITTNLNPYMGYRMLVRGDRDWNIITTSPPTSGDNTLMVSHTTLRTAGNIVYGTVTYTTSGVYNDASNNSTGTYSGYTDNTVTLNPPLTSGQASFSMLANPYISPINWVTVYDQSSNISAAYFYLDPTLGSTGTYSGYNAITGMPDYPDNSDGSLYIQPGEAFFVENSSTAAPTVVISEASKVTSPIQSVFGIETPSSKIYYSLFKKLGEGGSFKKMDVAASVFGSRFSNEYNKGDIDKFPNPGENMTIVHNGHKLQMDAKLPATATDTIAFQLAQVSNATYKFVVDARNYKGLNPYLYDSYNKTTTAIDGVDTVSFDVDTTVAASYHNRFSIVFSASKANSEQLIVSSKQLTVYPNPINGNSFNLKLGDAATGKYIIRLVNTLGQTVYSITLNHNISNATETIAFNKQLSNGSYIVTATAVDGTVLKTQVLVK